MIPQRKNKVPKFLGIDTSNYTTSAAVYDSDTGSAVQEKRMLPVKAGEKGLRQSDAVFHHTKGLPIVISELSEKTDLKDIAAVGVSVRPRNEEGSYMPCFLCGEGLAHSLGKVLGIRVYETSHQVGHILAALYSAGKLSLTEEPFLAFHVSGGTTDCLYCTYDKDTLLSVKLLYTSLDLKAGQLIDRTGVMLGLKFPCGAELEKLAEKSIADPESFNVRPVIKDGNCCLSGFENIFGKMKADGMSECDIALACEHAVALTVGEMTEYALSVTGKLPTIYAGGVMSNGYIQSYLSKRFEGYFAAPEFSCDNAVGVAISAFRI